ncbi:amino acid adenylation domain-containing protein [Paracoccus sp. SCSIO 75233]|uniref:amino acid adenylation domain-containing protein n=1 Tax=Paracoccus sp. SCSIO 75233 TaxID=3017782 RepID=UPI0022F038E9|nr:amino acid adenylation domain-containing protein [Paracoccus sp. SCSIO 75233]WBU54441.1 amino acid adenylation domain-containing protein [Paracoccus sp. SCSIO 75233]
MTLSNDGGENVTINTTFSGPADSGERGEPPSTLHRLTEAQEGLWYAQALDPANPILNTGQYLEMTGPLDTDALVEAVRLTTEEAQALHLRFRQTPDGPVQWCDPGPLALSVEDLTHCDEPWREALTRMETDSERPLDLAREPVAAFTLFRLGAQHHLLYERIHHLAIDGYGMVLVTNQIAAHYNALIGSGKAPMPFPAYGEVLNDDSKWRSADRREAARLWWHDRLSDMAEVTGPAGPQAVTARHFLRESRWLPEKLLERLNLFAKQGGQNWADVLTSLTAAYLARWTGGSITVGLPFMARLGRPIARIPCMAMNVLPQKVAPDEDRLTADFLSELADDMRQARRHGLYRSEYLRRELGLIGGARRLYGPLVNVQPFDRPPQFAGLKVALHILGAGAVDDLTLTFRGDPEAGILFEVDANPDLYSKPDVAGHSLRLPEFLLGALSSDRLAEIPTASPAEIATLEKQVAAARHPLPDTTLPELIETRMRATPEATALQFGGTKLSYAQLDQRSAALAHRLMQTGAGPDRIVAVALERSVELVVALVAILRAGAAYLPLDPEHPPDRLSGIIGQAKPVTVLTSPDLAAKLPRDAAMLMTDDWPRTGGNSVRPAPSDLAYVIFTSGSTGAPKGVAVEHGAIVNRLLWMASHYRIRPDDRILQKTPASFDVSVWEFFLPLITGATLVISPPAAHRDPRMHAELIRRHDITTIHFVPSMLSAFLAAPESEGLSLRRVFCSGEELTADLRNRFHRRIGAELHNLYGPTEAAVDVSYWPATPVDASNPVPIGWPVWNTRLSVLDDRMRPQPPGLAGNLYLGGAQLARGYLGRDDLTAERFIPDPADPHQRLYATGDVARQRHDGAVVFLGRSDHQVKIRGLRIELGEIEAAIMGTGLARETVVLAREDRHGDRKLVAYLIPDGDYHAGKLAQALAARLPAYMVPVAEIAMDVMPVTPNGKLDRKALPEPSFRASGRAAETASEELLARLFAEILHLPEPATAESDFFALGGDSLTAVRLILRIEEETGAKPGLGTVFEAPVLQDMADALARGVVADGLGPLIRLADGNPDAPPLFIVHPAGGLSWGYRHLARGIAPGRPVWGIQHPGLDPDVEMPPSLTALARHYASLVEEKASSGPVHLLGWSVGGIIAHAMATELESRGRAVGLVALLDSYPAEAWRSEPEPDAMAALRALLAIAGHDPEAHRDLDTREKVLAFLKRGDTALGALPDRVLDGVVRVVTDTNRLVRGHHHAVFSGRLTHIRAGLDHKDRDLSSDMWLPHAAYVEQLSVPFLHAETTSPDASDQIAEIIAARMV